MGRVPWDWDLKIPTLFEYANSIPRGFLDKFKISGIVLYYPRDRSRLTETEQSSLIEFIKRSEPEYLDISGLNLSREFYEQISNVQSIEGLTIGYSFESYLEALELEHLLRLKNLCKLTVETCNEKIPLEFLCKLVQLKFFYYFYYHSNGNLGNGYEICLEYLTADCDFVTQEEIEEDCPYYLRIAQMDKLPVRLANYKDPKELQWVFD